MAGAKIVGATLAVLLAGSTIAVAGPRTIGVAFLLMLAGKGRRYVRREAERRDDCERRS